MNHKQNHKQNHKKLLLPLGIAAAAVLTVVCLLHFFPVYRIVTMPLFIDTRYYSWDEKTMLLSIGSSSDRAAARSVLTKADEALSDLHHTEEENEEKYGVLACYATDDVLNASYNEHTLELLSAHLDDDDGYIWVYYSNRSYDCDGNPIYGNSTEGEEVLWHVQKDETSEWNVDYIRRQP